MAICARRCLPSAIETIGEKGVEGLSLRKLAKELGVSHAAPMRHFKTKADLLSSIVRDAYGEMTQTVLSENDGEGATPVERLNAMARTTIRWAISNPAKFSVMTNPDVSRFADPGLRQALEDFAALIGAALTEAQKTGFQKKVTSELLLFYAVGASLGVATLATDPLMKSVIGTIEKEEQVATIADMIVPLGGA